jgi:phosphonate transport system permease protein
MEDTLILKNPSLSFDVQKHVRKTSRGKIKIGAMSKSALAIKITMLGLFLLTVVGFATFDYKDIQFARPY